MPRIWAPLFCAVLAIALTGVAAKADPARCRQARAELASLGDGGSGPNRAVQGEIGRLQAYSRSLNCEGGRFLFFDTRPPQCAATEQRIKALQAGYGAGNGAVTATRRRQLSAEVAVACAADPTVEAGLGNPDRPVPAQSASGGGQVICVKTCDGSFFPMVNLPDGRGGADAMCKALCPGAEAAAYSMPYGDEGLARAASIKGRRAYTALPNAFKFRTNFEPNCSCKREGESWAQSLVKAESMLVRHKNDIFVTPMQAERLSRAPKVRLTLVGRADRTAASLAADAANREGTVAAEPTASGWVDPHPRAAEKAPIRIISVDRPQDAVAVAP